MTKIDRGSAVFVVLFSGLFFGTSGTAVYISQVDASSTSIAAARLFVGSVGLIAISVFSSRFSQLGVLWRRPRVWVQGVSVALYMLTFFYAVAAAGAAVASLVSISSAPLLAGLISRMFGKPWPSRLWFFATSLAVVGVILLSAPTGADVGNARVLGALSAAIAGASYAFYTVVGAQLVEEKYEATDALAAAFSIGSIVLLPFLFSNFSWLLSAQGFGLALWLGLVSTTLSYFMFGIGITHLAPGVVATLLLSEPAVATVLGVFVLDEPMAVRGWFGCALIATGLVLVSRNERKLSKAEA